MGVGLILPFFFGFSQKAPSQNIMLSFSILDCGNVTEYCYGLSDALEELNVEATVFFVGKAAEQNPDAVKIFKNNTDVGSQTYSYVDITSISDYTLQLEEIRKGKKAVDDAGNLVSRIFRAPFGVTDDNIYSLLTRSDILVDFSYDNQFNVYQDGQFIKFNAMAFDSSEKSAEFFLSISNIDAPIIITFDNTRPVAEVYDFVLKLKSWDFEFVKASEIVGFDLTMRGDMAG
jgi:peptidoglycan/xylan/chitin deacetylase (PgdA/CDA1 family)